MPNFPADEAGLKALRIETLSTLQEARAKNDQAAADAAKNLLGEVDDALDDLAFAQLQGLADKLATIRAKLDKAAKEASSWPFGSSDAPDDHERPFRDSLPDNDADDVGPAAPPPPPPAGAPASSDTAPSVSPGWAQNYTQLWDTMTIRPEWQKAADAVARKIISNQGRYATVVSGLSMPWWFIAVVHAMECSLKFNQHLHNGDPLTARTVQVPKGRPPVWGPQSTWEDSARDSIGYEKLDKVEDWSLSSVLFHWHRYNGINNEYKRRGIPTPYLWSGSQHYRKGKYIRDRVFDAEAVSGQVGAAVILRALIDLGAVEIKPGQVLKTNPAAATGHTSSLNVDTSAGAFKHIAAELDYPGLIKSGSKDPSGKVGGVRRVQEWLSLHDCDTSIDGGFGDSTAEQLKKFQSQNGREPTGQLDEETWAMLTAPMRRSLAAIDHGTSTSLEDAVIRVAQQHVTQRPMEVGGDNRGPWVRMYMQGKDGSEQLWCAGFVCLMVAQAVRDLGIDLPFKRQVGVDALVKDAKDGSRFIKEGEVPDPLARKSKLRPGLLFVVRQSANDWTHVGIVLNVKDQTFDTLEGNTSVDGSRNGTTAKQGNRSYPNRDFVRLL